ncbi:1-acyl-sn-glycerol-3-phosphate acyltransferase [Rhodothalassium salexigens DSM 2132]|uniref:1-acyl-sn-glycerol-3-phosphate acyltransferase n=1 Tax=Rhodothalassium salexigens DSM 2132 TaxID=1188247 RepID=A0A4R2PLE5_RHOSA|nr:lysophospholipid acyltransferase family protein [Rhodothalassium salexigens]MBB4210922.1 1-acyl-sn-glycerol-3-phosphate acyltransferase [Rhodothalassium salexigens DSM 2132]TCP36420.1 1-acyl-sn-glycerol-3-phosphate acyltransferase [Rhodothalassium salexigens DSM 2132]
MRSFLFALIYFPLTVLWTLSLFPLVLLPSDKPLVRWVIAWMDTVLWLARTIVGIRIEYRGWERLPDDRAYVFLAKHMSYLDVIAVFRRLPTLTALAKTELFSIPVIGLILKKLEVVRVDRGSGRAHEQMPRVIDRVVATRRPLLVYPEGTRARPGERRPLRSGAYHLQLGGRLPVYPVATNSGLHWPKKDLRKRPGTVVVAVGEPIPPGLPKDAFMAEVEARVIEASDQLMREVDGVDPAALPGADPRERSLARPGRGGR